MQTNTTSATVSIRQMMAEDIPAVAGLEQECFAEPWSENAIAESLADANYVFLVAIFSNDASILTFSESTSSSLCDKTEESISTFSAPASSLLCNKTEKNNQNAAFRETVAGYVGAYLAADELSITNIAVSASYRRCGAADRLMKALDAFAEEKKLYGITLEVRVSNSAAIALYEKNGYEKSGVRKGFYSKPKEDALIMWKYFQW